MIIIGKKDIDEMQSILKDLKKSKKGESGLENLEKEIKERGLEKQINSFEKKYSGQISDFIKELNQKGEMTNEEKTKMVIEMKKKLSSEQQKQFEMIMSAMKGYLKKK